MSVGVRVQCDRCRRHLEVDAAVEGFRIGLHGPPARTERMRAEPLASVWLEGFVGLPDGWAVDAAGVYCREHAP